MLTQKLKEENLQTQKGSVWSENQFEKMESEIFQRDEKLDLENDIYELVYIHRERMENFVLL